MPTVKSAIKRMKTNLVRNERNRKRRANMRTWIKKLRKETNYDAAISLLPQVISTIDKNVKAGVLHWRTADRYKSRLALHVEKVKAGKV
ncbi:MAG: 30S ribosomal protein S20 [Candidatus Glassbacteria bacterium]